MCYIMPLNKKKKFAIVLGSGEPYPWIFTVFMSKYKTDLIYKECREAPFKKPSPKYGGHQDTTTMKERKQKQYVLNVFSVFYLRNQVKMVLTRRT